MHCSCIYTAICFFFFNDTATTEIYTLSLHDALPICARSCRDRGDRSARDRGPARGGRSEEHTSELQSQSNLVCRLLLEKKNKEQRYALSETVLSVKSTRIDQDRLLRK